MNQAEQLNLAEGKIHTEKVFKETMEKAQGFFFVLGVDVGEKSTIVASFGGVMGDDLPRKVLSKALTLTLAIEGAIPFPEDMKECGENAQEQ